MTPPRSPVDAAAALIDETFPRMRPSTVDPNQFAAKLAELAAAAGRPEPAGLLEACQLAGIDPALPDAEARMITRVEAMIRDDQEDYSDA